MKQKTNLQKITSRFRSSYIWWSVLCVALFLMILLLEMRDGDRYDLYLTLVTGLFGGIICAVIFTVVMTSWRKRYFRKIVQKQGLLDSFNYEDFIELGYSRHFFISGNWLLWNRGFDYRILNRSLLLGAAEHPGQREGNAYAICDLYAQGMDAPMPLYYDKSRGVDTPLLLDEWIQAGRPAVPVVMAVPDRKICPACDAGNPLSAAVCEYCGTKLD